MKFNCKSKLYFPSEEYDKMTKLCYKYYENRNYEESLKTINYLQNISKLIYGEFDQKLLILHSEILIKEEKYEEAKLKSEEVNKYYYFTIEKIRAWEIIIKSSIELELEYKVIIDLFDKAFNMLNFYLGTNHPLHSNLYNLIG